MPPGDTRTAILDAALTLIGRAGTAGFSASALAAEVGVSKATLFHHFRSLDEIPLAAFDRLVEGLIAPDLPEGTGLGEVLEGIGAASFALASERGDLLRAYFSLVAGAMHDDRLRARFTASLTRSTEGIAALLAPRMAEPERAVELAGLVIAALDGMLTHVLVGAPEAALRARWERLRALLTREYADADRD